MTIAAVLGAGGAVGHAWHAGVLAAIEDVTGWDARRADLVVGTSAGSMVGALLRAGVGPEDLFARATDGPLSAEAAAIYDDARMPSTPTAPPRPRPAVIRGPASPGILLRSASRPWRLRPGLVAAAALPRGGADAGIAAVAGALHRHGWPDEELWVCAVRLSDGERVVFGREPESRSAVSVGEAVAASCAIPGWFAPISIDGAEFVDGGAHSPTNADLADRPDLDVVVVSSPMSLDRTALRRPAVDRIWRIGHRISLQREVAALRRRGATVLTIQPGLDDLEVMGGTASAMDPGRRASVATTARRTVRARLESPRLRDLLAHVR